MRIRLVHVTVRRSGNRAERQEILEADRLTVGRGTDNLLHIPGLTVLLEHCGFRATEGGVEVVAVGSADLVVNQRRVNTARLVSAGDVISVGEYALTVLPVQEGEGLALRVERVEVSGTARDELAQRTRIGINRGVLGRRKLSWLAALTIFAVFLAPPLLRRFFAGEREDGRLFVAAQQVEQVWSSGKISPPHAHFGDQCSTCHIFAFEPVNDRQCLACHAHVASHGPRAMQMKQLAHDRCTNCHREHNGAVDLAYFPGDLCARCHGELTRTFPDTDLLDASDFEFAHPEFRPAIVVAVGSQERRRVSLDAADPPRDRSGLKFPHKTHLRESLLGPGGRRVHLDCSSCHRPDATGMLMEPISFEDHCRPCHDLSFAEGRPAPHAEPAIVSRALTEYFASQALVAPQPSGENQAAGLGMRRRRPGSGRSDSAAPDGGARNAAAAADIAAQARERARLAAASLFDVQCSWCHVWQEGENGRSIAPVNVVPFRTQGTDPRLSSHRWLPLGQFSHQPHRNAKCSVCHDVSESESSETVALPSIAVCRQCHGGETAALGQLRSPCLLCHGFHLDRYGAMYPEVGS